jgi:hypothetical protein
MVSFQSQPPSLPNFASLLQLGKEIKTYLLSPYFKLAATSCNGTALHRRCFSIDCNKSDFFSIFFVLRFANLSNFLLFGMKRTRNVRAT